MLVFNIRVRLPRTDYEYNNLVPYLLVYTNFISYLCVMKNLYNLFEYTPEQKKFVDELIDIINSPEYNTIKKKVVKYHYKQDLCRFLYYYKVYKVTEQNVHGLKDIDKRGKHFHVDHIIPVKFAYEHGIDYNVIGDVNNLQVISKQDNFKKSNLITKQVKEVFSHFNINHTDLCKIEHPLIKARTLEKFAPPKRDYFEGKTRLSDYP